MNTNTPSPTQIADVTAILVRAVLAATAALVAAGKMAWGKEGV